MPILYVCEVLERYFQLLHPPISTLRILPTSLLNIPKGESTFTLPIFLPLIYSTTCCNGLLELLPLGSSVNSDIFQSAGDCQPSPSRPLYCTWTTEHSVLETLPLGSNDTQLLCNVPSLSALHIPLALCSTVFSLYTFSQVNSPSFMVSINSQTCVFVLFLPRASDPYVQLPTE